MQSSDAGPSSVQSLDEAIPVFLWACWHDELRCMSVRPPIFKPGAKRPQRCIGQLAQRFGHRKFMLVDFLQEKFLYVSPYRNPLVSSPMGLRQRSPGIRSDPVFTD